MSTKPMLTAVERYLAAQMDCSASAGTPSECSKCETLLKKATKEMEQEAGTAAARGGIRKILAAVDHQNHPALAVALSIAQPLRAQVAIVFVLVPPPPPPSDGMAYDMGPAFDDMRAAAKEMLMKFEKAVPPNALAFTVFREGPAADEILATAKDFNADLIIMGTHHRGALARFFLGSVSQSVLRKALCPVMFVTDAPAAVDHPKLLQNA